MLKTKSQFFLTHTRKGLRRTLLVLGFLFAAGTTDLAFADSYVQSLVRKPSSCKISVLELERATQELIEIASSGSVGTAEISELVEGVPSCTVITAKKVRGGVFSTCDHSALFQGTPRTSASKRRAAPKIAAALNQLATTQSFVRQGLVVRRISTSGKYAFGIVQVVGQK